MYPLQFGPSEGPLFGLLHEPLGAAGQRGAVLLSPWGHEHLRSHRAFRDLGELLSSRGVPVLRFDYYGTGDSAGDAAESTLTRWLADISDAVQELRDMTSVRSVALVGLRLGALLAALAAARSETGAGVSELILWDPVYEGSAWLSEMRAFAESAPGSNGTIPNIKGFPLAPALAAELSDCSLAAALADSRAAVHIITSSDHAAGEELMRNLRAAGRESSHSVLAPYGDWSDVPIDGAVLIPQEGLARIAELLT